MGGKLGVVLAVTALACLGVSTLARGVTVGPLLPVLEPKFGGRAIPRSLPADRFAPVSANISGEIKTSDRSHPPALREIVFGIDKDVGINAKGYPICRMRDLVGRDTKAAKKACGRAIVGEGGAHFEVAFPEQTAFLSHGLVSPYDNLPSPNPVLVLNGGEKGGKVTLLIHTFITAPQPAALVAKMVLRRKGGSGLEGIVKVPVIAEGNGSLLDFGFKLGKTYSHKGKEIGYLEAKCPDEAFKVNMPKVFFQNEAHTPGQEGSFSLKGGFSVPCTPKG